MTIYPWQQSQWQQVLSQYQQHRLPHALLLTGPQGVGKKDFAISLAQIVLCEKNNETACGACRGCQLFRAGNHPDFFQIMPEENSKTIKIDQIRALTASLAQTAQFNGYQVVIIDPAHAMNGAAANALLKTLEEPAGAVLLLLVSHQLGRLPITIASRCQRLTFTATDLNAIHWLTDKTTGSEIDALKLLKMTQYAPLLALSLKNDAVLSLRDQLLKHLCAITQENKNPIEDIEYFLKADLQWVLKFLFLLAMDLLRLQLNLSSTYIVNDDQLTILRTLSKNISRPQLLALLEKLKFSWGLLQHTTAVNLNLLLEGLFLALAPGAYVR